MYIGAHFTPSTHDYGTRAERRSQQLLQLLQQLIDLRPRLPRATTTGGAASAHQINAALTARQRFLTWAVWVQNLERHLLDHGVCGLKHAPRLTNPPFLYHTRVPAMRCRHEERNDGAQGAHDDCKSATTGPQWNRPRRRTDENDPEISSGGESWCKWPLTSHPRVQHPQWQGRPTPPPLFAGEVRALG